MLRLWRGVGAPAIAILSLVPLTIPVKAAIPPGPGVINYVEGSASIDGRPITVKDSGAVQLTPNQVLSTGAGKVEVLVTPGVLLRVGDASAVRLISANLTDTTIELLGGSAMIEAGILLKENHIAVLVSGAAVTLEKNGLYDFNISLPNVRIYDGQATLERDGQRVTLDKGQAAYLNGPLQVLPFDLNQIDTLYQWSAMRSQYLAEASAASISAYAGSPAYSGGPSEGWYWNPSYGYYSYLPAYGGFIYSPFFFGFFSPRFDHDRIFAHHGFHGRDGFHHGFVDGRRGFTDGRHGGRGGFADRPRGGFSGGRQGSFGNSFQGGRGFHGGSGFHGGGGGGFHGGGGGGFHGGGGRGHR